jgi:hydrogenase expression/formation protein HypC
MCLAVPGKLISIQENNNSFERMGKVSFGGVIKEVSLAYLPDVEIGNYVIVHVGFAISKVDEQAAQQTLQDFAEMEAY